MDSNKKKNVLIGFGGAAVVLAGYIAIGHPGIPAESSTGAIGAVDKFHQTQITDQDVVLSQSNAQPTEEGMVQGNVNEEQAAGKAGFAAGKAGIAAGKGDLNANGKAGIAAGKGDLNANGKAGIAAGKAGSKDQ